MGRGHAASCNPDSSAHPCASGGAPPPAAALLAAHMDAIRAAMAAVCRSLRLSRAEAEDFRGVVWVRLLENDCAVLRKFEGRSSVQTFLVSVIRRLLLDYRIAAWGKWRPSADARRHGDVAMHLERLVFRDGIPFDQALQIVRHRHAVAASAEDLGLLLACLPLRPRRTMVADDELAAVPAAGSDPEERVLRLEARRVLAALGRTTARLALRDRHMLALRFAGQQRPGEIARGFGLDRKAVYRRFEAILLRLRADLRREGITAADVGPWLGRLGPDAPAPAGTASVPAAGRAQAGVALSAITKRSSPTSPR